MKKPPGLRYLPLYDNPLIFPEPGLPSSASAVEELRRRLRERNDNSLLNFQMKDLSMVLRASPPL
jgi:hypothetical protein